jgi:acyl-coenzyme A synthetase/AMP-(fatty) acid ligase
MDIAKLIIHQARSREHEPAVAFAGGIATYGMLARAVMSAGEQLDTNDLAPGSIVGIDIRNPFHHVALILALELRGIATASVQTAFSVQQSGLTPAAILADGPSAHDPSVRTIPVDGSWFTTDPEAPARFDSLLALPGFGEDEALTRVVFSSGTTGVPKSTGFTSAIIERRIGHNLMVMGAGIGGARIGTMMGFSTLPGYMLPMTALVVGGTICFGGNPVDMLHLARSLRIDMLMTAVAQLNALLGALGSARPPGLGMIIATGSKIPQELLAKARERLCANIVFLYGSTEAGMIAQAPAALLEGQEGVAGYLMPWVQLEVVDGEDRVLPSGEEGVFRVRTPEQAHYLIDGPDNAAFLRDGWFYPGDVGRLRADGVVHITGRSVEVINRGGSVVAPDLIERVLMERPEIIEAAAFGVPGKSGMEEIWAAVVSYSEIDEPDLIRFCGQRLADKAPNVIRRVAAIPRTESGKIRRREVRDEVTAARAE